MIRFKFVRSGKSTIGFECSGHAGFAQAGQDIVCAAVSAAVELTITTVNDVCGGKAKLRVKEEDARVTLTLPAQCEEEESIQAALTGLMLYLCNLRDEYSDYIEVLEV